MWEKVLNAYCERGADPSFWGEPLNAITNAGFTVAALALFAKLLADRPRDDRVLSWFLALMILVISIGSFLFHTLATRWAGAADTIPILIFILAGLFGIVRRGFGGPLWAAWLALPVYVGATFLIGRLGPALGIDGGLLGYGPALLTLLGAGLILGVLDRPGSALLIQAGLVFTLSLTLRTLDKPYCDTFTFGDWVIGTHWAWHLLNALTLYLVATALIWRAGRPGASD